MTIKKIAILSVLAATIASSAACVGMLSYLHSFDNGPALVTNINSDGIKIKRSTSGVDSSGNNYIKFSYSIEPANSLDTGILVTTAYKDGTSCSDVLTVEKDENSQTITITCLKNFTQQIILTITCQKNTDVKATATIDYQAKINSVSVNSSAMESSFGPGTSYDYSNAWVAINDTENVYDTKFKIGNYVLVDKIDGSIDFDETNYSLTGTISTPSSESVLGNWQDGPQSYLSNAIVGDDFLSNLRQLVWNIACNSITEGVYLPDSGDIYELANNDQTIIDALNVIGMSDNFEDGWDSFTVTDVELYFPELDERYTLSDFNIYYSLTGMTIPSEYYVSITSINVEQSSFVF